LPDGVDLRWYLNDASLQGQFDDRGDFERVLRSLVGARARVPAIRQNLRSTRSLQDAPVAPGNNVRQILFELRDRDLKAATLSWLDKAGPFVDDDRLPEVDDYFEFRNVEVTASGLGEAARRTKAGTACSTYSFIGGQIDYATNPLQVDHGLLEERYGQYAVNNLWQADALIQEALVSGEPIRSWSALADAARLRFPHLELGALDKHPMLAREPFETSVRDRSLALMKLLNDYVAGRAENGAEGPRAREIVSTHFNGDRASFSGESAGNRERFRDEMTFSRSSGENYFAHWHGKISHRFFRMHFEWPLDPDRKKLEIFYLGPKITKS
jgi:hypothetical protein